MGGAELERRFFIIGAFLNALLRFEKSQLICFALFIRARDVMDDKAEMRCEGAVHDEGRSINVMGFEPAVVSDRPTDTAQVN